jgi:ABC-type Zn uptake system ZnuABC Zn-binding protein ZnuA
MIRQVLLVFLIIGTALSLTQVDAQTKKKTVATTFTVLQDMARNVAGDKLVINSITKPGAEIHGYAPTPSDIVRAQQADLVLYNGLNLELWFEKFYRQIKKVPRAILTDGLIPIGVAEAEYKGKPNPHAWMSPKNALIYVENIRQAFVKLEPSQAATFNANAKKYSAQIRTIDQTLKNKLGKLPISTRALVTCEGAFSYAARDYGLQEHYLWAVNSGEQGTPRQIQKVIDVVRKNKIPAVFCESTVELDGMKQVAKESGAKFGGILFVDSLSPEVPTYLKMLEHFANTVITGLSGS